MHPFTLDSGTRHFFDNIRVIRVDLPFSISMTTAVRCFRRLYDCRMLKSLCLCLKMEKNLYNRS